MIQFDLNSNITLAATMTITYMEKQMREEVKRMTVRGFLNQARNGGLDQGSHNGGGSKSLNSVYIFEAEPRECVDSVDVDFERSKYCMAPIFFA